MNVLLVLILACVFVCGCLWHDQPARGQRREGGDTKKCQETTTKNQTTEAV